MNTINTTHRNAVESPLDRFARRIESLEGVGRRRWMVWAGGLVLIGGVAAALLLLSPGRTPTSEQSVSKTIAKTSELGIVGALQPSPGKLTATPREFSWGAVQGSSSYTFQLMRLGDTTPLVERTVQVTHVELTPEEAVLMEPGQSYVWKIVAMTGEGTKVAESESYFDV